ncbi:hypothetical protein DINM_006541 [Dirofilaria immitis]|nr:hypothetical protein [Dirofilaria immitis]
MPNALQLSTFDESSKVFARISSPSVIAVPEYPLRKVGIMESERNRSLYKKSNWMSNTTPRHALSGRSKQRNWHFVDRDPPSDESKSDYLDPLDLNLSQLHDIYIANNSYQQSRQTDQPPNESIVTTYA